MGIFLMKNLQQLAEEKILVLDGAMGTMIQRHSLSEAERSCARPAWQ
jgi:methionine synthase I (cobalamin-dependent)